MKRILYYLKFLPLLLALPLLLTACDTGETLVDTGSERELAISFDLSGTGVLLESVASDGSLTRAANVQNLADGTLLSIRAYKKVYNGDNTLKGTIFADAGVYQVETDGTKATVYASAGTGAVLQLTRGTYDLYFLSYNSTTEYPATTTETEAVDNGQDLIATSLKDVIIQADKDGQVSLTISLDGAPFSHLCSRIQAELKVPKNQPVLMGKIEALNISVGNLNKDATYEWQKAMLAFLHARDDASSVNLVTGHSFAENGSWDNAAEHSYQSPETYVLPLDETAPLKFNVTMHITYQTTSGGNPTTDTNFSAAVELPKMLLPGKSYRFVFTLTYYGILIPSDLTLDVVSYIPVDLHPGDVGGD